MTGQGKKGGFADMFAEMERQGDAVAPGQSIVVGREVTGTVVAIGDDAVFVDLGGKAEGMLERSEVVDDDGALTVALGDTVKAHVTKKGDGPILLRKRMGRGEAAADALRQAYEHRIPVEGKVTGVNKGGVDVEIGSQRAFCPKSQLESHRVEDFAPYVGRELTFLVTKLEESKGRLDVVVSRRSYLDIQRKEQAEELRQALTVGTTMRGTVTNLKDYGAFVDLGGLEGMLHVSELAHKRVRHPRELLTVGEEIQVQILDIQPSTDPGKPERISLSLKALADDPWDALPRPGETIIGTVTKLEDFGVFVEIGEGGLEGLVHISELEHRRIQHPREVVSVGDSFEVVVLSIDHDRRRLSLSKKAVGRATEQAQAKSYAERKPSGGQSLGTFADLLGDKLKKS